MSRNFEIEYKNLLTQATYQRMKSYYSLYFPIIQENTYFDTNSRTLFQKGISLRIRQLNQSYTLTLKLPINHYVEEYEALVASANICEIMHHPLVIKYVFPLIQEELLSLGTLHTSRVEVPYRKGLLCIDHNHYLNHEDYELEYELATGITEDSFGFQQLLNQFEIPEKKAKGKFFRFIQILDSDI